ncbi:myb-related protein 306 [Brachypodium distachyon]|uniref:Uncharacterized protein n=1 Tax=Brachypodium distachyon TaxID=15368 RepID=I1INP5_BRADI|nr:myb-related protein 306 [Brachypodium distachyon]KQJ89518.1 hypothetical protein BRADI_4g26180v3 [Brachypodium distachyon]|eukprot:XP_003576343.1 myb-related protein 306 [Brachypodium distachyon]
MGRPPCCDKVGVKKGPWTPEEDLVLVSYVQEHGPGNWRSVPASTGLARCSKSCRLRWTNYLRPGIRRGSFTPQEDAVIAHLQSLLGNRWAAIATYLPKRTDNDIKNYWNTHLKKRLQKQQAVGAIFAPPPTESAACSFSSPSSLSYASSVDNISRLLDGFMKASLPPPASSAPTTQSSQSVSDAKDKPGHAAVHFIDADEYPMFPAFHDDGCCISGSFASDQQQQVPLSSIEEWLFDEAVEPKMMDQLASSSDECYSLVPMLF